MIEFMVFLRVAGTSKGPTTSLENLETSVAIAARAIPYIGIKIKFPETFIMMAAIFVTIL